MKKFILFLTLFLSFLNIVYAQERKEFDFVITVDDDDFCMINAPQKIYLQNEKGEKTDIGFRYHPGNLSISKEDYEKIKSFDGKIEMHFGWDKHLIGETRHYFYDIPLEKRLFEQAYVIIKIYNMDDKRYRKMYYPLKGKNYNYTLISPAGICKLLTRKEIKMLKRKKLWPSDCECE